MSLLGDDASDISVATNTTTCSESSNISSMDFKGNKYSKEHIMSKYGLLSVSQTLITQCRDFPTFLYQSPGAA